MRKSVKRSIGALVVGVVAGSSPLTTAPAQAVTAYGCIYPQVCIYDEPDLNSQIVGRFKDVTNSPQYLTTPRFTYAVYNSRNDDVVYITETFSGGQETYCVRPNVCVGSGRRIIAIRISTSPVC